MSEVIRRFVPGVDDAALARLWDGVFGVARGGQTLEWLFRAGPAGASPRAVVEIDGRIVAHAGASALRFRLEDEEVRGGYSVGAMTHPAFRGRGLYVRAAQFLYEEMEREGFAFVAGFSNRNSHRLMTAPPLSRVPLQPFPWSVRILRPVRLLASLFGRGGNESSAAGPLQLPGGDVRIAEVSPGDPRLDNVWIRAREAVRVGCVRDAAYSHWRYGSRPDAGYRVLLAERSGEEIGYMVQRSLALRGVRAEFLLEFVMPPREAAAGAALLRAAAAIARAEGSVLLSALLPARGPSRDVLRRAAFLRIPEALHPQLIRFSVRALGRWKGSKLLTDPRAWQLSWGDTDVV